MPSATKHPRTRQSGDRTFVETHAGRRPRRPRGDPPRVGTGADGRADARRGAGGEGRLQGHRQGQLEARPASHRPDHRSPGGQDHPLAGLHPPEHRCLVPRHRGLHCRQSGLALPKDPAAPGRGVHGRQDPYRRSPFMVPHPPGGERRRPGALRRRPPRRRRKGKGPGRPAQVMDLWKFRQAPGTGLLQALPRPADQGRPRAAAGPAVVGGPLLAGAPHAAQGQPAPAGPGRGPASAEKEAGQRGSGHRPGSPTT